MAEAEQGKLLKQEKPKATESWSQFMHNQMTCVHKIFVYYTGYKTGAMRQQFPHWAFGTICVDPNEPHRIILPNTWTFHGHNPWLQRRGNGKDGEWLLTKKYAADKAPKDFLEHVKTWASSLRPGSMLAIAVGYNYACTSRIQARGLIWWRRIAQLSAYSIRMLDHRNQRGGRRKRGIYGGVTASNVSMIYFG